MSLKYSNQTYLTLIVITISSLLTSCATEERFVRVGNSQIGKDFMEFISIQRAYHDRIGFSVRKNYWNDVYVVLDNGNKEYKDLFEPNCTIFWEVDSRDIIVNYRYEGSYCKLPPDIL